MIFFVGTLLSSLEQLRALKLRDMCLFGKLALIPMRTIIRHSGEFAFFYTTKIVRTDANSFVALISKTEHDTKDSSKNKSQILLVI